MASLRSHREHGRPMIHTNALLTTHLCGEDADNGEILAL